MKNLTDFQKTVETGVNLHLPLVAALSPLRSFNTVPVSYTHLRAHETDSYLVCRLLLEKKN